MWQQYSDAVLEREYSPSSVASNYPAVVAAYSAKSEAISASLVSYRVPYGASADEYSIVFPALSRFRRDAIVIFIHGGYWQELSAEDSCFPAREFVERGVGFAAVNYTLAPVTNLETMVQQCANAIRAIAVAHPEAKLVIAGSSAGAHLAAMTATLDCDAGLAVRVKGYVLASGVYDLRPIVRTYVNQPLHLTPESAVAVSPMFVTPRHRVRALVCWGEHETAEFKRQSRDYAQHLSDHEVPVRLLEIAGRNHFDILFDLAAPSTEFGAAVDLLIGAHAMAANRKRVIPEVRNPALELSLVRDIDISTNESRDEAVKTTAGEPMVSFEGKSNPYIDYHRNDLLLSIQHMRSEGHDEMVFILMTQCKELTFKAIHYELYNMQLRIRKDDVSGALELAPRVKRLFEYLVKTWDVLSTITTHGFNEFRNHLGVSSGQQSYIYRHVEFILGNKSKRLAAAHSNNPDVYPQLKESLNSPSLYDDVLALLHRRGVPVPEVALKRDWSQTYESNPDVEKAWLTVYADPSPDNDLYVVGEALIEIADLFSQYRWRHFTSVERILGFKPGTGGSAGVGWLKHVVEHRFFPELWSIRTVLGA